MKDKKNILVTGGVGFIGSNLVETLLRDERVGKIRVLDNLATGHLNNIEKFLDNRRFEFVEGDIRDYKICKNACEGMDLISHQAALGSVPRSIKDPLTTNDVNISGTLNIFKAAVDTGIKRVVFAASSSTYGDSQELPKREEKIGKPLSPYAVTKYVNELYAEVFTRTYEFEYIGLRYFNVFGPRQDPNGAYAAVIPLFFKAAIKEKAPTINGDGNFSRDFTYIDNAVQANVLSLFTKSSKAINEIYNVACGEQTTLNAIWELIKDITDCGVDAVNGPKREGDIPHSLANITKAKNKLGYKPNIDVKAGLIKSEYWYKALFQ